MIALRDVLLLGSIGVLIGACAPGQVGPVAEAAPEAAAPESARAAATPPVPEPPKVVVDPVLAAMYASRRDGERTVRAIDVASFDQRYLRQRVPYATSEPPGTIVIDTATRHLFLVEEDGQATRYGVAIGREGFGWTGEGTIGRKAHWPRWTPPPEMIARDPTLAQWREGMPGGPNNPLGARALYIYFGDQDSQYRVHGTNEPRSIGRAASSGCFRMLNQDVIDLYARVDHGARVVVR